MPTATKPSSGRTEQSSAQVYVYDPALVVVYFFNGVETWASVTRKRLAAICDTLADKLCINEPFTPSISRIDLRYIHFDRYQWNSESLAALVQFHVAPSQIWCIQLALPVHLGPTLQEQALVTWRKVEHQLSEWLGDLVAPNRSDLPMGSREVVWGSSRLYWALSDELAGTADESLELARAVQPMARPEPVQDAGQGAGAEPSPVRYRVYDPQGHTGDYGTLWRLDEPAAQAGPYQAAWLLLSPEAQNDAVALGYILNGRFAVGESYLCKAHYQAGEYTRTAKGLEDGVQFVRTEISELLALRGPSGFAPDQIKSTQDKLRQQEARIDQVATAYSHLLLVLPDIDRLHRTVTTNLDNYVQMASEFKLWDHPATHSEIARWRGTLKQIELAQRIRRASLQGFHLAIETVRGRLELVDNRLSIARLEIEQEEAGRSKRWDIVVAILGLVLGASQVVVLRGLELVIMVLLLIGVALGLALILAWRRVRRTGKRRK